MPKRRQSLNAGDVRWFAHQLGWSLAITAVGATILAAQSNDTPAWHLGAPQLAAQCRAQVAGTRARIDTLLSRPVAAQTFATTVRPVEDALGQFTNATSTSASLLYLSPDKAIRDSSSACYQLVSNFSVEVFADPRLYRAAKRASAEKLPPLERMLVTRYVENTRHGGGALDSTTRARTTTMLQRLSDLGREFGLALSGDSTTITISDSEAAGLPAQFRSQLKPAAGGGLVVPVDESTVGIFLRNEPSSDVRRRYYVAFDKRGGMPNIARLRAAVATRDTLAHLFGFPSWAAYQLDVKVAKTPDRVLSFLRTIDRGLLPKARAELAQLAPLAQADKLGHPVAVWDVSYYSEKLRKAKYALDAEAIRQYFPVEHVVRSVLDIYSELFGLTFTEVTPADAWAPDVKRYAVRDAGSKREMGTIYLDLFPRPDKYDHFASFPLIVARRLPDGTMEKPVAGIVGNWPAPGGSTPSLLSHGDVETFFHEFGHAVATISDTSPYVGIGNSSLRQDFVEALSQMLENWMWQPAVLQRVSHHVTSGQPLPDSLITRMIALKHFRDGTNGTAQAFYAAYDMALHSSGPSVDPLALWMRMKSELTPLPAIEGSLEAAGFGHLMSGYDAGYYGYLWSKVYAQDLYTRFEREGAMNHATGRAYRREVLAPGATSEPDVLLQRFLGRPLSYDAFFREMGIAAASARR